MKHSHQVRSTVEQRYRQVGCSCGKSIDDFTGDDFYQHIKQKGHKLKVWFNQEEKTKCVRN